MNLRDSESKLSAAIRAKHYSLATEKKYVGWARAYAEWCKSHPSGTSTLKLRGFLTDLAVRRKVSASTQNQALNAIIFFYREVMGTEPRQIGNFPRAKRPKSLPVVLSKQEMASVLRNLRGHHRLIAGLLYGCGLRITECLSLRIKDIDFDRHQVTVSRGKGEKDRTIPTPLSEESRLRHQISESRNPRATASPGGWPRG